jgi:HEPN domain-containing protein
MRSSKVRIRDAATSHASGDYPDTVRYSSEAVELSFEGLLEGCRSRVSEEHDVSEILKAVPDSSQNGLDERLKSYTTFQPT